MSSCVRTSWRALRATPGPTQNSRSSRDRRCLFRHAWRSGGRQGWRGPPLPTVLLGGTHAVLRSRSAPAELRDQVDRCARPGPSSSVLARQPEWTEHGTPGCARARGPQSAGSSGHSRGHTKRPPPRAAGVGRCGAAEDAAAATRAAPEHRDAQRPYTPRTPNISHSWRAFWSMSPLPGHAAAKPAGAEQSEE
jgi:hypothetical protein